MILLIWFLGVSAILIIALISVRWYELANNRNLIPAHKREVSDKLISKKATQISRWCLVHWKRFEEILHDLPHWTCDILHSVWTVVSNKIDSLFDKLHGNRKGGKKGAVSLYWHHEEEEENQ